MCQSIMYKKWDRNLAMEKSRDQGREAANRQLGGELDLPSGALAKNIKNKISHDDLVLLEV